VEGAGGLAKQAKGALVAYVDGALSWSGKKWLSGKVAIGTGGVSLAGNTRFAVDLTPDQLPGGIKVAGLFLQVDLQAEFKLDAQAGLVEAALKGSWAVGARLAADSQQVLPLAMQSINIELEAGHLEEELLKVEGFKLLPFNPLEGAVISIPVIRAKDSGLKLEFGKYCYYDGSGRLDYQNDAIRLDWLKVEWAKVDLVVVEPILPLLRSEDPELITDSFPLEWELAWQGVPLDLALNSEFTVSLAWRDGRLMLKVSWPGGVKYISI